MDGTAIGSVQQALAPGAFADSQIEMTVHVNPITALRPQQAKSVGVVNLEETLSVPAKTPNNNPFLTS